MLGSIFKNSPAPVISAPKVRRDSVRETLETIVFVVVLVFLLKQFVVEAFVIPTGSMAETLYGYQKEITCNECGFVFPLNSSCEVEGDQNGGGVRLVQGYCCPNCRNKVVFGKSEPRPYNVSGDRVLVHKAIYHREEPTRGDVVVFKFPDKPQKDYSAQNYIKRLWGLGGETLAISGGDLYVTRDLTYPADALDDLGQPLYPRPERPEDIWRGGTLNSNDYTYSNAVEATAMFQKSRRNGFNTDAPGFKLIRKTDAQLEAMKRIVWDNEFQSSYLASKELTPRLKPETTDWATDAAFMPKVYTHTGPTLGWVRYKHRIVDDFRALPRSGADGKDFALPRPVDNFLGYNAEIQEDAFGNRSFTPFRGADEAKFWVGDLIIETKAVVSAPTDEIVLELSKGPNRFQAKFAGGTVTLTRTGEGGKELVSRPTAITGAGTYHLTFANVDCSLRVWVDGRKIDFGTDADYSPAIPTGFETNDFKREGWTRANDIEAPASLGAVGGVEFRNVKIWRDTYFINDNYATGSGVADIAHTYYIQPGHYMCLGDNSAQSSDGRSWGLVPERLMLGKAAFVFFPIGRVGFIK